MILTICPNPSIDCTIELPSLNVGRLNRIDSKIETYSGKALNVAIGIARLKGEVLTTGFMFDSHKMLFENNLNKEGVKFDFVYNHGNARTNYKIIDKKSMLTEINDRGEEVNREKQLELIEKVKELSKKAEVVVLSGSLPKGVVSSYYGELVSAISKDAKIIIDAEKENMLNAIDSGKIFMAKPNLKELEDFSEMPIRNNRDIIEGARRYISAGVENVLVSLGSEGAILTDGKQSYFCKSASVAVNSTVGAGDSMISAYSLGLVNGKDKKELLKWAVSAGTASVTTSGTNLFYKDKYDEIYNKIKVEDF